MNAVAAPSKPWLLRIMLLMVAAAALPQLRFEVGSLLVPLHNVVLLAAIPTLLRRYPRLPPGLRVTSVVFLVPFCVSVLRNGSEFGEAVKMVASVLLLAATAVLVRNRRDFIEGATCLAIALLLINLNGLVAGLTAYVGYEPLHGIANKNGYSLYALPAMLLSGWILLHEPTSKLNRMVHIASMVTSAFVIFTGANRSGWLGAIAIAVLLTVHGRRWRAVAGVVVLGALSFAAISLIGNTDVFEYRVNQTREGYSSDEYRGELIETAFDIATENPLLGLTPQRLRTVMAARTMAEGDEVDTHNVFAYFAGGSGFPTLLAFLALLWSLWRKPFPQLATPSHWLVRLCVILLAVRGMFSSEIMFSPVFMITLGLGLGMSLSEAAEAQRPAGAPKFPQLRAVTTAGARGRTEEMQPAAAR